MPGVEIFFVVVGLYLVVVVVLMIRVVGGFGVVTLGGR